MSELAGYTIRPAVKADLAALVELELACFGEPGYPIYLFRQMIDLGPDALWLIADAHQLLGYAWWGEVRKQNDISWLLSFAIHPSMQGQGLGSRFLAQQLAQLQQDYPQSRLQRLTVSPSNVAAVRLYQKHGFVIAECEADYYGPGSDRLLLERVI